ncbi:MAG: hypothetical protein UV64_C0007G0033 [Parcubacteria group bacterium GW2011_GWC1_43_11b]|nr:MAG: hypothetical protein UV64_C0007G0033 [Parcubacteria group bacterium GW2011_GWC1_43_11b]
MKYEKELQERICKTRIELARCGASEILVSIVCSQVTIAFMEALLLKTEENIEWLRKYFEDDDDERGNDDTPPVGPEPDGDGGLILAPEFKISEKMRKRKVELELMRTGEISP